MTHVRAAAARVPTALWVIVAVALALRLLTVALVWPATIVPFDPGVYVDGAEHQLFNDQLHPAGYPLFLRILHVVSGSVATVAVVQHALGLVVGLLVYALGRRAGLGPWPAALPAAAVLFAGASLYLENVLLTECLFTFLLWTAIYLMVRASGEELLERSPRHALAWSASAGLVLGVSAWTRTVSAFLIPVCGLWLLWAAGGRWGRRLTVAGGFVAAGAVVVLLYAAASAHFTGAFGLSNGGGWAAYARTAQFADCSRFDPPAGTRALCESTAPAERHGPTYYHWNPESPAQRAFGAPPNGNAEVGAFARAAIAAQPAAYAEAVGVDLLRYAFPNVSTRLDSGGNFLTLDLAFDDPNARAIFAQQFGHYYGDLEEARVSSGARALADVTGALNLRGVIVPLLFLAAIVGAIVAPPGVRRLIVLYGGLAALLLVIPVATLIYNARYGVPAYGALALAGVLGMSAIVQARRRAATPGATVSSR